MDKKINRTVNILLVEDNLGDIRLTQEAFRESSLDINLIVVMDGVEALKYIDKKELYADAIIPDLVLLDLNMPRKGGLEVLEYIKNHYVWKKVPVVILTTSDAEKDVLDCYERHANSFITKPVDYITFSQRIRNLEEYWLKTIILPTFV